MKEMMFLLTALCAAGLRAQTVMDLDVSPNAGVTAGVGGGWDFNSTTNWTSDGGTNRVAWTNNAAIARIRLETAYGWGSVTMAVSNNNGQVGAKGLVITGNLPDWKYLIIQNDPLQIGSEGIAYGSTNGNTYLTFNSPVVLTAPQVWRSANARFIDGGGTIQATNTISSFSGTTDITFDGMDRCDPGLYAELLNIRPGFRLSAENTYSGTTTVSGGAVLWLIYNSSSKGSRLGALNPLVLKGGSVWLNGSVGSAVTQAVASTTLQSGFNIIRARNLTPTSGRFYCGAITRSGLGGTADFPINWAGGVDAYTTTTNISGILGGWATWNRASFATAGTDGNNTVIGSNSGSSRAAPDNWAANDNVKATGGGTRTLGDVTINYLLISASATQALGTATLTVKSGGIFGGNITNNVMSGGTVRSGFATGELFVYADNPFTFASVVADNGGTPGVLVKGGTNTLTLTAANTYSGATYLNSGILIVTNRAVISGTVVQAGGTTLDIRNGGALSPGGTNAATLTLNGNLKLGDGAVLNMQIGSSSDLIALSNPFATLTGSSSAGGVTLNLAADRKTLAKGVYTVLQWDPAVTLSGFDLSDFTVVTPSGIGGTLQFGAHSLDFNVTSLPAKGTRLSVK